MSVVVITGVSTGIGLSLLNKLAAVGSTLSRPLTLIGISRRALPSSFQHAFRELDPMKPLISTQSAGGQSVSQIFHIRGDISNESTMSCLLECVKKHNRLDALYLNAATAAPMGTLDSVSIGGIRRLFEVNFFAQLNIIQMLTPFLQAAKGNIIALSTGLVHFPAKGVLAYASSKAAFEYAMKCISLELRDVKSIIVHPGIVKTEMFEHYQKDGSKYFSQEHRHWLEQQLADPNSSVISDQEEVATKLAMLAFSIPQNLSGKQVFWRDLPEQTFI